MNNPHFKVTLGTEVFEDRKLESAQITCEENNFDTALLTFDNTPNLYPTVAAGSAVTVEVKDASFSSTYTKIFVGTVLYPVYGFGSISKITFQCAGTGYPLNMMNCAEEYGEQSRNPTVTSLQDITTDLINSWVNIYMNTPDASGYNINIDNVEDIAGTIPYIPFPYKPVNKCLDDLCDLLTAINGTGPHWIVDVDSKLRIKNIGTNQTGWTKYYGGADNTAGQATLTQGIDFIDGSFEPLGKEANVVVYYGTWRRPSSGDTWTNTSSTLWGTATSDTLSDDSTQKIVGADSVKNLVSHYPGGAAVTDMYYPSAQNAAWDFNSFTEFNTPNINFYLRRSAGASNITLALVTAAGRHFSTTLSITDADTWQHFSFPIGPYANLQSKDFYWQKTGTPDPDWANINYIQFIFNGTNGNYIQVDGLHFGSAAVCRIARQEFPDEVVGGRGTLGQATNPVKTKVLTDNIGKDDSLSDTDDSGLMAQLAKAELLRLSKATNLGKFTTNMIPDILPGQYVYIGGDWRITRLTHTINANGYRTAFEVTDDLTNSHTRLRYEDINKQYASIRPEWQDRQSSSIKTGNLDIRIARLQTPYNV
jgi:hypothetical protein